MLTMVSGGDSSVVTPIKLGDRPIVCGEADDEGAMVPVRASTGKVEVVDEGNLGGLVAKNASDVYVRLERETGELEWQGFLSPDTRSQSLWGKNETISLSVVSPVEMLKEVDLKTTEEMGIVCFGKLIAECMAEARKAGAQIRGCWLPSTWSASKTDGRKLLMLTAAVARRAFFSKTDQASRDPDDPRVFDGVTAAEFLERFCLFWGLTLYERGTDWWFRAQDVGDEDLYYFLSYDDLAVMSPGSADSWTAAKALPTAVELRSAGTDQTFDWVRGYDKFRVVAKIDAADEPMGTIEVSDFERFGVMELGSKGYSDEYTLYMWLYQPVSKDGRMSGNVAVLMQDGSYKAVADLSAAKKRIIEEWGRTVEDIENSWCEYLAGCFPVRRDFYKNADVEATTNPKVNYQLVDCWAVFVCAYNDKKPFPSNINHPAFSYVSDSEGIFNNGAFCLSGRFYGYLCSVNGKRSMTKISLGRRKVGDVYKGCPIQFSLKVGDLYWDGEQFQKNFVTVSAYTDDGTDDGSGQESTIVNTKTLEDGFEGADGYLMKIPDGVTLTGKVELVVQYIDHAHVMDAYYPNPILCEGLELKFVKHDGVDADEEEKQENRYMGRMDEQFCRSQEDWNLDVFTDRNNGAAYNKLMITEVAGGELTCPEELYNKVKGEALRPERRLVELLKANYGHLSVRRHLTVRGEDFGVGFGAGSDGDGDRLGSKKAEIGGIMMEIESVERNWKEGEVKVVGTVKEGE